MGPNCQRFRNPLASIHINPLEYVLGDDLLHRLPNPSGILVLPIITPHRTPYMFPPYRNHPTLRLIPPIDSNLSGLQLLQHFYLSDNGLQSNV